VFLIQVRETQVFVCAQFDSARILNAHVAFLLETYLAM
jgi:hypothetical protein